MPRLQGGTTKIKQLIATGINIAYGQDFIKDSFYPWGNADPLDIGILTAHIAKFNQPHEIETLLNMPTYNSAKILNLKPFREMGTPMEIINEVFGSKINYEKAIQELEQELFIQEISA